MTFTLGNTALSPDAADIAEALCREQNLTRKELYIKWEVWALSHSKTSDAPTAQELTQLSNHLRFEASKSSSTPVHKRTPASIRNALFYNPQPLPQKFTIDDFFSYVDDSHGQQLPDASCHPADSAPLKTLAVTPPQLEPKLAPNPATEDDDLVMAAADVIRPPHIDLEVDTKPDQDYVCRQSSGRVEATLNDPPLVESASYPHTHVSLQPIQSTSILDSHVRYMNDAVPSRIEAVRAHIRNLVERILARLSTLRAENEQPPKPSPESFFVRSPDVVMAAGRIRVELDGSEGAASGRINPSSVVLESEDGNLVALDLGRMHEAKTPLFLHPGMVVVVEGVNTNGRRLQVHALYDNAMSLPQVGRTLGQVAANDEDEILLEAAQPHGELFATALFAAGPYTTNENLNYEPLDDLLAVVVRSRPDVVFLAGPFVDAEHDQISAATPVPFEQIFEKRVLQRLRKALSEMPAGERTQVVLIPSLEDVHNDFVCPQPAMKLVPGAEEHPNISLFGNPTVVKLSARNNAFVATVGMTSIPALQDISGDCLCWNKGDRFSAIASSMLRQCSFYPTFPATAAVPLDTSLMDGLLIPETEGTPTVDVLVAPSRLKAFAKCVDGGAVAINPGLLCRGSCGGTYAEVKIPLHDARCQRPHNFNADKLNARIVRI